MVLAIFLQWYLWEKRDAEIVFSIVFLWKVFRFDLFFISSPLYITVSSILSSIAEVYPRSLQTSTMESFAAIAHGQKLLTIVAKLSILDVCRDPGYTSATDDKILETVT